jgi:hypothetical protein
MVTFNTDSLSFLQSRIQTQTCPICYGGLDKPVYIANCAHLSSLFVDRIAHIYCFECIKRWVSEGEGQTDICVVCTQKWAVEHKLSILSYLLTGKVLQGRAFEKIPCTLSREGSCIPITNSDGQNVTEVSEDELTTIQPTNTQSAKRALSSKIHMISMSIMLAISCIIILAKLAKKKSDLPIIAALSRQNSRSLTLTTLILHYLLAKAVNNQLDALQKQIAAASILSHFFLSPLTIKPNLL